MTLKIELLKQSYPDRWDGLLAPLLGLLGTARNPVSPADLAAIVGVSEEELAWALQLLAEQIVGSEQAGYRLNEQLDPQFLPLNQLLEREQYIFAKRQIDPAGLNSNLLGACRAAITAGTNYQKAVELLPELWRYSLLRARLHSCAEHYPDALFVALIDAGRFDECFEAVQALPDLAHKIRLLSILVDRLSQIEGKEDQARRFIRSARKLWQSFSSEQQGILLFTWFNEPNQLKPDQQPIAIIPVVLIPQIAKLDLPDTPLNLRLLSHQLILNYYLQIAKQPELAEHHLEALLELPIKEYSPHERDYVRAVQAAGLLQFERYEASLELIKQIEDGELRFSSSLNLVEALAKRNQLESTLAIIEAFPEAALRDRSLSIVVEHNQMGIEVTEAVISRIHDTEVAEKALGYFCHRLARQGDYEAAFKRFETIKTAWIRNWVATLLMEVFAHNQQDQLVEGLISSELEPTTRAELQAKAAIGLAHNQRFGEASMAAKAIPVEWIQNNAFEGLALAYAKADQLEQAEQILTEISEEGVRDQATQRVVKQLAQAARFQEAERYAEMISNDQIRLEAYQELASALAAAGQLAQARKIIERVSVEKDRTWALSSLVIALVEADEFETAQTIATGLPDERGRSAALGVLAQEMAGKGQYALARSISAQISVAWMRNDALRVLGTTLAHNQQLEAASEVASLITKERIQAEVLSDIVFQLAHTDQYEQAYHIARSAATSDLQDWLLGRLVSELVCQTRFEQARAIADLIVIDWLKHEALETIAAGQDEAQHHALYPQASVSEFEPESADQSLPEQSFNSVLQSVTGQEEPSQQAKLLQESIQLASNLQELEQVQDLAQHSLSGLERDEVARQLVLAFGHLGHYQAARSLAETIDDQRERTWALGDLGTSLIQAGQLDAAEELAGLIEAPAERGYLLKELALAFIRSGNYPQASSLTKELPDQWSQNEVYQALIMAYAQQGQYDQAYRLLNQTITEPHARLEALQSLARYLEDSQAWEALVKLIQSAWIEANSYSIQTRLLGLAHGLIKRQPSLALPIADGFAWSDRYFK